MQQPTLEEVVRSALLKAGIPNPTPEDVKSAHFFLSELLAKAIQKKLREHP